MTPRDLALRDKDKAKFEALYQARQVEALEQMARIQSDHTTRWDERTLADQANIEVFKAIAAEKKALRAAESAPRSLGVVVVAARVESRSDWESMAKAVSEGRQIIDVDNEAIESANK